MSLGLFLFLALFIPAVLSLTGVTLCREIIIDDLRQRLPDGLGIKYPRLGLNLARLLELHRKHCPGSRLPVLLKFLTYLGLGLLFSLGMVGLLFAFLNSAH